LLRNVAFASIAVLLALLGVFGLLRDNNKGLHVPSGAVAVIEGAPGGFATLTKAEFLHGMQVYGGARSMRELPKPGDRGYPYLKMRGLQTQFEIAWVEGTAVEEGVKAVPKEVAAIFRKVKRVKGGLHEFFAGINYNHEDLREAMRLLVLRPKIYKKIGRVHSKGWPSRTFCAPGYIVEGCAQWDPADHPGKRVHFVEYG
jgi:hypothetical protein